MDAQVQEYLNTSSPAAEDLFLLWGGHNDFVFGQTNPTLPAQFLSNQISSLAAAGARNFLVGNLAADQGVDLSWVQTFNMALYAELSDLRQSLPGVSIFHFDYFTVFEQHKSDPGAFGFTNVTGPACRDCGVGTEPNPTDIVANAGEYYFWDDVHWTGPAHRLIGDSAFSVIPEPSSAVLAIALGTVLLTFSVGFRMSGKRDALAL
jgi:outer membrane lipase/esterase